MPNNTAYCLSKVECACSHGPRGGVARQRSRGRCASPGAVETPINTATMNDPAALKKLDEAIRIGRMARPEEIGSVVASAVWVRAT